MTKNPKQQITIRTVFLESDENFTGQATARRRIAGCMHGDSRTSGAECSIRCSKAIGDVFCRFRGAYLGWSILSF